MLKVQTQLIIFILLQAWFILAVVKINAGLIKSELIRMQDLKMPLAKKN